MMERHVTARQREILVAIVENYIATGEPVGSGTLARSEGAALSAATIRNEMAELADAGLLEQPHTSAGRVPSAQAFRMYVEGLSARRDDGLALRRLPGMPRAQMKSAIDERFAGVSGSQALLECTSRVLAAFSSGVGVAIGAVAGGDLLEHVHFSRLTEKRVHAVVVTRGGVVRDRVLALDRDVTLRDLEAAAAVLNENFRGWNIESIRAELALRVERERSEYQRLMEGAQQLWQQAVPETLHTQQQVFVDGVANLAANSALPEDRARLHDMLAALEAKQRMVELLNAYIDTRQESVRVVFDLEDQAPEMAGLVLIAAPARGSNGETLGAVGVLGSKRLHYENAMNAVEYVAQVFSKSGSRD